MKRKKTTVSQSFYCEHLKNVCCCCREGKDSAVFSTHFSKNICSLLNWFELQVSRILIRLRMCACVFWLFFYFVVLFQFCSKIEFDEMHPNGIHAFFQYYAFRQTHFIPSFFVLCSFASAVNILCSKKTLPQFTFMYSVTCNVDLSFKQYFELLFF